ncbi:MAG: radical SAM/Cys-rich domain protein [Betaproteobacteria bacterium]|nr:radical SAM/Cys-rich domain protein [Betaproteobacteria bacterium]
MHATLPLLEVSKFPAIRRRRVETLQVNLGYKCNQTCLHCHVNAGPTRTEMMDLASVEMLLEYLRAKAIKTLDITGGAPELNEYFRYLVREARRAGARVIDRCNLTILEEPGQEGLAEFLADQGVEIVASLPCYTEELVERQRGKGVYEKSIRAIKTLNGLGYAMQGSGLDLNLVYNPQGPSLPPEQASLEADYKRVLGESFGIRFNRLYTLANMPIARFGSTLISNGLFNAYMTLLRESYQDKNLDAVMCRDLISVDWQGYVYDCDFNQMLGLPLRLAGQHKPRLHLSDLLTTDLEGGSIVVKDHCFGCTAGQGSSCGGALAA